MRTPNIPSPTVACLVLVLGLCLGAWPPAMGLAGQRVTPAPAAGADPAPRPVSPTVPTTAATPPPTGVTAAAPAAAVATAGAGSTRVAGWQPLIDRLAAAGLDRAFVTELFTSATLEYSPEIMARKVDAMVKKEFEPRPKPSRKSLEKSNYRYFLTPAVTAEAVRFVRQNQAAFDKARREYGPPPELVAAFLVVETHLGSYLGDRDALSVLASLARASQLADIAPYMKTLGGAPARREYAASAAADRANWAFNELVALVRYAAAQKRHPKTIPGSIYGAIGICQFMPSNALRFGVDADGDGVLDLFCPADAIVSVASYLRGHGWKPDMTPEETRAVVYAYNHSDLYVLAVLTVAERIKAQL